MFCRQISWLSFSPLNKRPSEDLRDPGLTVTIELADAGQTHAELPSVYAELLLVLPSGDMLKPEIYGVMVRVVTDTAFWNTT